ncbi:MAG: tetratricopeptide repeat protein [Muribaculaceae bacterium]|nr:tetratricopeptide repeat protein [Muribaculaceae bacterium]
MTQKELNNIKKEIVQSVKSRRMNDVFKRLKSMAEPLNLWHLQENIRRVEESYLMMLKYTLDGVDDPNRETVYAGIVSWIYHILDVIIRETQRKEQSTSIYFSTLRFKEMQRGVTISQMLADYAEKCNQLSMFDFAVDGENDAQNKRAKKLALETLAIDVFDKIWVTYPLSIEDETAISEAMVSKIYPAYFKQLLISALFLGLMAFYDNARLRILLNIYQQGDDKIVINALCAIVIALIKYHDRITDKKIFNQIDVLKDMPQWHKDVKMVYMQLVKSSDTERVSRKMQDELLPEMMKLRPDLSKKITDNMTVIDLSSMDENPEWQEFLENSGIANKMKELTEMQEDGSDVFLSTFAQLKSYPFFVKVANWFLPFYVEHSEVASALGENDSVVGELISSSPFLCNSDKYSFALTMRSIPESQRSMMMSQINDQNVNIAELRNADLFAVDKARENKANKYIQDIYRFFKLFRHKEDFEDPFKNIRNFAEISLFYDELSDVDFLSLVGEFYFKRKYYEEAFKVFDTLSTKMPPSAQLFQKMGYAMQQQGIISEALTYYEQSELLNSDNLWTLRHIAHCHKQLGNTSKALEYYKRVDDADFENLLVTMNIGHCYLAQGKYEEALKYYYKVEFLDEKSTRAWRPIAWCSLLSNDFEQSQTYYKKIIKENPDANDYLNYGHLHLAIGDYKGAVECYKKSIKSDNNNQQNFISAINADTQYFGKLGIKEDIIPFVIDAVKYSITD